MSADHDALWCAKHRAQARLDQAQMEAAATRRQRGGNRMRPIKRIWQGRKECAVHDYFVGQVFDADRQRWIDVTREHRASAQAEAELSLRTTNAGADEEESE